VPERACKGGALPAELHAHGNCVILIDSVRENLQMSTCSCLQVLAQTDLPALHAHLYRVSYFQQFPEQL